MMGSAVTGVALGLVAMGAQEAQSAEGELASQGGEPATVETPRVGSVLVEAPLDIELGDNLVSLCIYRPYVQNCDYRLETGSLGSVHVPLKGAISIASIHVFDDVYINQLRSDLNMGIPRADAGYLRRVLSYVGGGCDVTAGNTLSARMAQFWSRVSLSPDKRTLSWDLTGTNAALFDDYCRQVQDSAKLTLFIPLPLISSGTQYRTSIILSNDPAIPRPNYVFQPILITNT
ncbi:hypothetical protein MFUL124B02_17700 [Myxococcus fulvus 124B02]|nr:hypothetical protein MFUL124B02_17700 [Myxococcus fulvus 124B02]